MHTELQKRLKKAGFKATDNNDVLKLKGKKVRITMRDFPKPKARTLHISAAFVNNDGTLVLELYQGGEGVNQDVTSLLVRKNGSVLCNHAFKLRGTEGQNEFIAGDSFKFILN